VKYVSLFVATAASDRSGCWYGLVSMVSPSAALPYPASLACCATFDGAGGRLRDSSDDGVTTPMELELELIISGDASGFPTTRPRPSIKSSSRSSAASPSLLSLAIAARAAFRMRRSCDYENISCVLSKSHSSTQKPELTFRRAMFLLRSERIPKTTAASSTSSIAAMTRAPCLLWMINAARMACAPVSATCENEIRKGDVRKR